MHAILLNKCYIP